MALTPPARVDVTPALVRGLLAAQHPDLAHLPLVVVASGWDNVVLRLGDDLAVRMPRRDEGAPLILHEQQWLPRLAPALGVPVPAPVRLGVPSDGTAGPDYPWAWSVVPWFHGTLVRELTVARRAALAQALADVVVALHVPAPAQAPVNAVRGVGLHTRTSAVHERLASGAVPRADEVRAAWDALVETPPWAGPPLWLHGDLHPANLLARDVGPDSEPELAAVLDFGDMTSGDPATDLATAWLTFDAVGRTLFYEHVQSRQPYDDATWARARGWGLTMTTGLLAHSDDAPAMRAMGLRALDELLDFSHPGARQ
ncbi:hypothetical protein GCM10011331_15470 [Flavimobilis marinus]|uniref:Predicted kinase, aminoglycoside phosphotransferase (APT) family n=1 Tax=Flavimobilis marinus TaxID=285351 RepID=A0A1I2FPH4_9MICO|nr:aminoglycoside phosphotransferase family protein [Flavimobilis marinus]GHG51629.1 hypothetical protein GCM10011331_15470 [Flavimobilis marinus]SFF06678.1 Predicted kinase, aminoglycoside phosphotransferase (APT) family [Flavimobilis marinus]